MSIKPLNPSLQESTMSRSAPDIPKLKILLVGDAGVGKTSIMKSFVLKSFDEFTSPTISSEFRTILYPFNNRKYRLQIWDIAG